MEREWNYGVMVHTTLVIISMDRNMGKEYIIGQMALNMMENGHMMK